MKFADRLKEALEKSDMKATDLANAIKVSKSTISQYLSGTIEPRADKLYLMAKTLGVAEAWLIGYDTDPTPTSFVIYPVVGEIKCGYDGLVREERTGDTEQIPTDWTRGDDPENFYVLTAKSDSLFPLIQENDRLLIHRTSSVQSGTIAVIQIGDEVTLKRVFYRNGEDWIRLEAVNPSYPPRTISGTDLDNVRVLGEVRQMIRRF